MLRFAEALQDGKLIPPALLNEATTPQNIGHWYGYGFETHGNAILQPLRRCLGQGDRVQTYSF